MHDTLRKCWAGLPATRHHAARSSQLSGERIVE